MSGFCSSRRHSATRRFSPPDRLAILASHGGRRSASAATSSWFSGCARRRRPGSPPGAPVPGQRVEVGAFLGVGGVHRLQRGLGLQHFAHAFLDRLAHGLVRVQFRFLRQVTDLMPGCGRASPSKSVSTPAMIFSTVDLPAPFRPSRPIFAPGKKDRKCPDDLPLGRDHLGHAVHGVDVLRGHAVSVGAALRPTRHGNIPLRQRAQTGMEYRQL